MRALIDNDPYMVGRCHLNPNFEHLQSVNPAWEYLWRRGFGQTEPVTFVEIQGLRAIQHIGHVRLHRD